MDNDLEYWKNVVEKSVLEEQILGNIGFGRTDLGKHGFVRADFGEMFWEEPIRGKKAVWEEPIL